MLNSTEHEISTAHKTKILTMKKFLSLSLSEFVFTMLISGILTFMSRINFVHSRVENGKKLPRGLSE